MSAQGMSSFDSELRLPQGYTKGRRPETSAFLRSIASGSNEFECRGKSLSGDLDASRDSRRANPLGHRGLIRAKTLARLSVSRRLGYRVLRALFRSQQAWLQSASGSNRHERNIGNVSSLELQWLPRGQANNKRGPIPDRMPRFGLPAVHADW